MLDLGPHLRFDAVLGALDLVHDTAMAITAVPLTIEPQPI
jgi:hypothetical protein